MTDRDRDAAGRARNARPRDRLGRPLPRGAAGAIETIPDDFELPPEQSLAYAQRLLDDGLAFSAHEVLEAAWKNGPAAERNLWQGLAQLAVGVTHIQRGNRTGAVSLLQRGSGRLAQVSIAAPYGVDIPGLLAFAAALADDLAAGAEIGDARLRPRLTA